MAKVERPKVELILALSEREELVRLTKRAHVNRALAFRARIILGCDAASNSAVAAQLRTTNHTVGKWRKRFVRERLDNHSVHNSPPVQRWLLRHSRFVLQFTPTYVSWLNQVERFFGLLTQRALQRGQHTNIPQLRKAINNYVDAHNELGKAFTWTKAADAILEKMRRFGLRAQQANQG